MIKCRFIKCAFRVHSAMPWDRLPSRLQMCVAIINKAQCNCIPGFTLLNIKGGCVPKPLPFRTDFPRPDIVVNCPTDCLRKHKLSVLFMKEVNKDGLEKTNIEIMGILAFLSHYSDYLYTDTDNNLFRLVDFLPKNSQPDQSPDSFWILKMEPCVNSSSAATVSIFKIKFSWF